MSDLALLYLLGGVLLIGFAFARAGFVLRSRPENPVVLASFYATAGYFLVPAIAIYQDDFHYQERYQASSIVLGFVAFALFMVSAIGFFHLSNGQKSYDENRFGNEDRPGFRLLTKSSLRWIGVLLLPAAVANLLYFFYLIMSVGGLGAFIIKKNALFSGAGFMQMPLQWFMIWQLIYAAQEFAAARQQVRRPKWSLVALFTFMSVSVGMVQGSRTRALLPVLLLGFTYMLIGCGGKLNARQGRIVMFSLATLAFVAAMLGAIRQQVMSGRNLSVQNAIEKTNAADTVWEYENVWWMLDNSTQVRPLYGSTLVAAAVGLVPRALWEDKPVGGGPMLLNIMHPGSYDLTTGRASSSITTGIPAEGYMNFGWPGFLIFGAAYGLVLSGLAHYMKRVTGPVQFALWMFVLIRVVESVRTEIFGAWMNIIVSLLAIPLVFLIARYEAQPTETPTP